MFIMSAMPHFFKGDSEFVKKEEKVMVFVTSPSYAKVVEKVQSDLNWMDKVMYLS